MRSALSTLWPDDIVPLALLNEDIQCAQGRFAAECEAAGIRISDSKADAKVP